MRKSRFTDVQIIGMTKEQEAGMPSLSSVRLIGRRDPSTSQRISSFSDAGYLFRRHLHPRTCFFLSSRFSRASRQRPLLALNPSGSPSRRIM